MKEKLPNRIREIRKAKKVTLEELASRIGDNISPTTIGRLESGTMQLTPRYMRRIAAALGVPETELIAPATVPIKMVPVLGTIPAGPLEEAIEHPEGYEPIPARIGGPRVFILRPKGDSMGLVATDQDYVVFDPDDLALRPGFTYAVRDGEGNATFKRYQPDPPRLEPDSANPDHKSILIGSEPFVVIARAIYATHHFN